MSSITLPKSIGVAFLITCASAFSTLASAQSQSGVASLNAMQAAPNIHATAATSVQERRAEE